MASITKDPLGRSPFFLACFTAYLGQARRQWKKSTATADRKLAQRIADELEEAAQGARPPDQIKGFLAGIKDDLRAQRAARKAFEDVLRKTTGTGLGSKTVRGFVNEWLGAARGTLATGTWSKYRKTADQFLELLAGKADQDMAALGKNDVARFRDAQARRTSPATANLALKIVRIMFAAAESDGLILRNEARKVKKLKDAGAGRARRPFTLPELERILGVCDEEWHSLVLFGLYTGARLGDLAALTWQAVDLANGALNFVTRKTHRVISIPLAQPLQKHLEKMAGDDPKAPLHPRAYAILGKHDRVSMLSRQFGEILAQAGMAPARTHAAAKDGPGRAGRRAGSEVSFHALRHTAVSLLKNAGVSDAVARDIVGHESAAVSRVYTHIDDEAKSAALNKLPVIGKK